MWLGLWFHVLFDYVFGFIVRETLYEVYYGWFRNFVQKIKYVLYFEKDMVKLFFVMIYFNTCKVLYGSFHYF